MSQPTADPRKALVVARTVWLAMTGGVAVISVALGFISSSRSSSGPLSPEAGQLLFYVSAALVVATIPIGIVLRGQVFKRHWVGEVVEPGGYVVGNLIVWAICEAICLVSLVGCFLAARWWPNALPGLAGWLVLVALWPNGRAMFARSMSDSKDRAAADAPPDSVPEFPAGE